MVIFQYNLYIFGSIFEPCYIQSRVITNRVIKRLVCIYWQARLGQLENTTGTLTKNVASGFSNVASTPSASSSDLKTQIEEILQTMVSK